MSSQPEDLARRLSTTTLLGRGLAEARTLAATLAAALGSGPNPALELELYMVRARLRLQRGEAGVVAELVAGEKLAAELGDRTAALRLQLLGYRALGEHGMPDLGAELIETIDGECAANDALAADWRLARAACHHPDARSLWLEALDHLRSPEQDHDRLAALIGAAHTSNEGGDFQAARRLYDRALALASAHGDEDAAAGVCFFLANLLLLLGLPAEAEPMLLKSIAAADRLGDTLVVVAHGTVLAALRLDAGDWAGAIELGARVSAAGQARGAWIAFVDGALVRATALAATDRVADALRLLLEAARTLREERARSALHIVKARLGELRLELGAERFDAALAEATAPR